VEQERKFYSQRWCW